MATSKPTSYLSKSYDLLSHLAGHSLFLRIDWVRFRKFRDLRW